jgi:hypothetical protein
MLCLGHSTNKCKIQDLNPGLSKLKTHLPFREAYYLLSCKDEKWVYSPHQLLEIHGVTSNSKRLDEGLSATCSKVLENPWKQSLSCWIRDTVCK